ncbi:DUF92 domain-containing protein [Bacillus tianshenii]|uniref:DUF92 domain-containing protein n=1 Tax=Sutcliffiella tianshenii TaxID=1463404 RepID=UPI001CD3FA1B|nr:DUF92 domain-containing protein [Bacillus tianshenii]MCA1318971.1 DUF92 domain-containing protein [Bacillus tianshenii]
MTVLLENNMVLLAGIILLAGLGYKGRALSKSGAIGTCVIGILIAAGFKGYGLLLIGIFFITSSLWSRYKKKSKASVDEILEKGSQRDIFQVFANGMVPALFSLAYLLVPSEVWMVGFITAIAAANADTWASEIGTLSKKDPISILTLKRVSRGTSGAISLLGTIASVAGAGLIAASASLFWTEVSLTTAFLITLLGILGCFVDTVLGAFIQATYRCSFCGRTVESPLHCGKPAELVKGFRAVNNDVVNIGSILMVALFGVLLAA